ncbi:DNA-3-methyladenine glycosylase I, partial [Chromobacterium piscinae]
AYHDREWGRPERDDQKLFEMLVLEGSQAGLSWITILRKREGYRAAFHGFDPAKVAAMTDDDVERLMQNPAIVRNRLKIRSAIRNAKVFLRMRQEHGSFANWLWAHVDGQP